jgi:hypothetical protein
VDNALVFNLEVGFTHTYTVLAGQTPFVVHNCNDASISGKGLAHIMKGHGALATAAGKSRFNTHNVGNIKKIVAQVVKKGNRLSNPNGKGHLHELDFGRKIGTDKRGHSVTRVRVVVNRGRVTTAHPF